VTVSAEETCACVLGDVGPMVKIVQV
jgi:hypothetical protein